jgi:hypothetical protein
VRRNPSWRVAGTRRAPHAPRYKPHSQRTAKRQACRLSQIGTASRNASTAFSGLLTDWKRGVPAAGARYSEAPRTFPGAIRQDIFKSARSSADNLKGREKPGLRGGQEPVPEWCWSSILGKRSNVSPSTRQRKDFTVGKTRLKSKGGRPRRGGTAAASSPATACHQSAVPLHFVGESSLPTLAPGDILVLDEAISVHQAIEPVFFAVVSCPRCGTPRLITAGQFFGGAPIICESRDCAALYRIIDQDHIDYLPVN